MSPKTMQVPVGDTTYTVRKLNTAPASVILLKLMAMLGGSLMALASLASVKGADDKEREAAQLAIIRETLDDLVTRNDPVKVNALFEELLTTGYVHKNGAVICHLDEFPELDDMFAVLVVALQLSFGEFIKKQLAKLQVMKLAKVADTATQ
jgi:hypothetical protein